MNIYVVPEIDIERFKETGVFAVRLLNNEAMTHDGIYLESDGAKEFAELFEDNIFPAEKFEELVEWGLGVRTETRNDNGSDACRALCKVVLDSPNAAKTSNTDVQCAVSDERQQSKLERSSIANGADQTEPKGNNRGRECYALGKTQGAGKHLRLPGKRNLSTEKKSSERTGKSRNQQSHCKSADCSFDTAA